MKLVSFADKALSAGYRLAPKQQYRYKRGGGGTGTTHRSRWVEILRYKFIKIRKSSSCAIGLTHPGEQQAVDGWYSGEDGTLMCCDG